MAAKAESRTGAVPYETPGAVIDALGGTSAVAVALRVGAPAVSLWRRNGIPATRFAALEALAASLEIPGVTMQALARLGDAPRGVAAA